MCGQINERTRAHARLDVHGDAQALTLGDCGIEFASFRTQTRSHHAGGVHERAVWRRAVSGHGIRRRGRSSCVECLQYGALQSRATDVGAED